MKLCPACRGPIPDCKETYKIRVSKWSDDWRDLLFTELCQGCYHEVKLWLNGGKGRPMPGNRLD